MKKKLLFLIHNLNMAGAQRVLLELVNNLDFDRFDVTVQALFDHGSLIDQLNSRIRYRSIVRTKHSFAKRVMSYFLRKIATPEWVYKHYIEDDYDYAVAFLEGECTRYIGGCHNPRTKTLAWVHIDFENLFVCNKCFKNIDEHRETYQRYHKIVCVSKGVARGFVSVFGGEWGDKVVVKYNIIDAERILAGAAETPSYLMPKQRISIVMVGNMRQQKGYDRLLPICRRLVDEGYRFHLTIVGSGSEYENVQTLLEELQLQEYVTMTGNQANPYGYMVQADMLLLASYTEGFCTVVIESMVLGVPPMVTQCSGMDEILDNGKYGIILPNTAEGIYEGLKRVLEDPSILDEYRERLPQRKAFFDKENALNAILELFE